MLYLSDGKASTNDRSRQGVKSGVKAANVNKAEAKSQQSKVSIN